VDAVGFSQFIPFNREKGNAMRIVRTITTMVADIAISPLVTPLLFLWLDAARVQAVRLIAYLRPFF
jgi:hypothetical protein